MQHLITRSFIVVAAAATLGCASQPQPVVLTTSTSGGDVASTPSGMWTDGVGGTWMDSTGAFYSGPGGTALGLQPTDFASMSNANIVAHLSMGDSLEIALSQLGVTRAQNQAVRDFAQRMVTEHSRHMQMGQQMAAQAGIAPAPLPADTMEASMATHMMTRLGNAQAGANFDRQFMRAEVMMHQHMLHELNAVRPQSTGAAQQLVDQTIPVVQQHLGSAQSIWQQVGGGMNGSNRSNRQSRRGANGTNGSGAPNRGTPSVGTNP